MDCSQLLASADACMCCGQFMTDLDVNDARLAMEVACPADATKCVHTPLLKFLFIASPLGASA